MADRPINLRVTATGTEDAAKAIARVDEATGSLAESTAAQAEASQAAADAADAQAESQRRLEESSRQYQDQLEENQRRAQREADVVEATRRRDEREAGAAGEGAGGSIILAGGLKLTAAVLAGKAIAETGKALFNSVRDSITEVQKLTLESGRALQQSDVVLSAISGTIETLLNPIDALKAGFESLSGLADLREGLKESSELAAQTEKALSGMIAARAEIAEQSRVFSLAITLQRERQEIDNQTAALQRQIQVLNARRGLIDAQGTARDAAAIRAGADVNDVASAAVTRQAEAAIAALQDQAVQARAALERAKAEETAATNAAVQAASEGRAEEAAKARLAADAAGNQVATLAENLRNLVENVIPLQEAEIRTTTSERLAEIGDNVGRALAEEAQKVSETLAAKAAEQGGVLSLSASAAMESLAEILEDGIVRPEEIGKVQSAMQLLRNSVEARDAEIFTVASSMATTTQETLSLLRTLATREAQNRAELAILRRMIDDIPR